MVGEIRDLKTIAATITLAETGHLVFGTLHTTGAVRTIDRLGSHSQTILRDNYRSVLAAQRMKESIERLDSAALFMVAGHASAAVGLIEANRRQFVAELQVAVTNLTEVGESKATQALAHHWDAYQERFARFLEVRGSAAAGEFYFDRIYPVFLQVKRSADLILEMNQDAMVRKSDLVQAKATALTRTMMVATVIATLTGVFLATLIIRRLLRPLSVLTQAARRIGQGDLDVRARIGGSDEAATLAAEFNTMADSLQAYQRSSLGDLLRAQQTAQAAIDSLPDPVLALGLDGRVLNANAVAERWLPLRPDEQGRVSLDGLATELQAAVLRVVKHVLGGHGPYVPQNFQEAVRVSTPDGDRVLMARGSPLYGESEDVRAVTVVLQDITRMQRFDELKNDLVSTVAHEFRTPLTSLHMAIHLCLDETVGSVNEKQADLLYAARHDCERLQNLVNDLLDLSRIQSGRVEMKPQVVSVGSLLAAVLEQHGAVAAEAGIELVRVSTTIGDERVAADPERIPIVLTNFIVNAVRHTPRGGTIELRWRADDGKVRFEVADTGEGIPPDYVSRVFDRFCRVPGAKRGGVGLGLSIAREIVVAHGGEIGAESVVGKGSTFWFTLPLADARAN